MSKPVPIAIVGMACRLPGGANSPSELWDLLASGRSGWREIPAERWNAEAFYHRSPETKESLPTRSGYFLQHDVSQFDPAFFGIPAFEAHGMDPQQRILLEVAYEALEHAGIPVEGLRGSDTSVFVGIFERDYDRMGYKDLPELMRLHVTGAGDAIMSNRISYVFDLKGPSMTIDTGCSGSLVALHQASQSLRTGESTVAIVGGTQLLLHPDLSIAMSSVGLVNPDGKCYPFDSRGGGYGRSEGIGAVILKRLDRALADGDHVHAVIANSGVNQDGKTDGMSVPSGEAQAALIRRVYAEAGLDPAETVYVEAHGTGTKIGDREETMSISKTFCEEPGREGDLWVGSIKANIGHLEASSGIAGLLKLVLMLKHKTIPPNLNFEKPKPGLMLDERKIKIPTELTALPTPKASGPVRVSLNSFGYGGTNCHVILESPEPSAPHTTGNTNGLSNGSAEEVTLPANGEPHTNGTSTEEELPQLFVLSAASERSLLATAASFKDWLASHHPDPQALRDLAYTLSSHRSRLAWRSSFTASTPEQLALELGQVTSRKTRSSPAVPLAMIFTGQGAQWHAMGRELISFSRSFGDSMRKSDELLRSFGCDWSLVEELSRDSAESRLGMAETSQPATTAVQIALVDFFSSLSVKPAAVLGHSSGEIGAAYAAGALDHESAMLIAYKRGLSSSLAKKAAPVSGSMMAVGVGESDILPHLQQIGNGTATVACVNSPSSTTISGDETAVDELKEMLDEKSVFARKLKVDTAYHSHHMKRVSDAYLESLGGMSSSDTHDNVAFYSSVTGSRKTTGFGAEYWTENLVAQVKFSQGLQALREGFTAQFNPDDSAFTFLEIGPHSALAGPIRQTFSGGNAQFKHEYVSALVRGKNADETALSAAGRLHELGYPVDLNATSSALGSHGRPSMVTDLKPYPWDYGKYWHESRLSRDHRFRKFPYHDLCGLLDPMSSSFEPRWRYHANLDALPWLKDHVVDGFIIYPGAGYICMAIEAVTQLVAMRGTQGKIAKYVLRDVAFRKSIIIPDIGEAGRGPEVEMQLTMTPSKAHDGSRWETFRVCSYGKDGQWSEHCTGLITAEMAGQDSGFAEVDEGDAAEAENLETLRRIQEESSEEIDPLKVYKDMRESGNNFGPTFATINDIKIGHHKGVVRLGVPDIAAVMPYQTTSPHVVHPVVFDAAQQLSTVLFKRFLFNSPSVPVNTSEITISADITKTPGTQLVSAHEIISAGNKTAMSNSWVFEEDENGKLRTVMKATNGQTRAIGEAQVNTKEVPYAEKNAHKLSWGVDVDHLTDEAFNAACSAKGSPDNQEEQMFEANQAAALYFRNVLDEVDAGNIEVTIPHLVKYVDWMRGFCASEAYTTLTSGLTAEDEQRILQGSCAPRGVDFEMLARIGDKLPGILAGKADPLALMLEDNMLYRMYEEGTVLGDYEPMKEYVAALAFKRPHLSFVEIGAGTGGATTALFEAIAAPGGAMLEKYLYTDISAGFFGQAQIKFARWAEYMEFKTLDIERDPEAQGFAPEGYDVVVASNVLHATRDMDVTMANVRKLLKPGGVLLLLEVTHNFVQNNAVFGTLPGWWAFEDGREDSPLLSKEQWTSLLHRHSFSGIDLSRTLTMVSTAVETTNGVETTRKEKIKVLRGSDAAAVETVAKSFSDAVVSRGFECTDETWEKFSVEENTTYVVVDCTSSPLLPDLSAQAFDALLSLSNAGSNLLWVTVQETDDPVSAAAKGMADGLARVLRRETDGMKFITFTIQTPFAKVDSEELIKNLLGVAESCFWPKSEAARSLDTEFTYRDGQILISRLENDPTFINWVQSSVDGNTYLESVPYHLENRPLKLQAETPGLLNSLRFVDDDVPSQPLGDHEIQITTKAHGINFKDVFIALGQMLPGVNMVGESAGVVTAVGASMRDLYKVGDRVAGFGAEPFASRARLHGHLAHRIPDSMGFDVAATVPVIYLTAYYCLVDVARLEAGQTILIHAASGGVGQAAIQIAQHIGADIFATVGSAAKRDLIAERYKIPKSHIFSSRARGFKDGVLRLTGGEGVDVVLNSLSGESLADSLECVRALGTFVEIGKSDIYKGSYLNMVPFDKSITFAAVDLVLVGVAKLRRMHQCLGEIMELFEKGALSAVESVNTFPVGDVEDAFRMIAGRKHTGKVVLQADEGASVRATPAKPEPLRLRKDGTYVIAGGLGDLGRRSARFMAEHGAGHIVTLSRRDLNADDRANLIREIEELGASLHIVKCDITDVKMLEEAVSYCAQLPPVRGVLHGGMVLRDHPFSHMTLGDWNAALGPKVHGTINLDKHLASADLDFFICLSSVSGIMGRAAQSNYAAGNGFQDSFAQANARHPHTQYISINVGAVKGSDSVAFIEADAARTGVVMMSFTELFKSIEYCMGPQARKDGLSQQALGFGRESLVAAGDEHGLANPFFSRLPYSRKNQDGSGKTAKVDIGEAVSNAKSLAEAEAVITDAAVAKFAVFLNKPVEEIREDLPLSNLGLDSLVSIELKNWMVRTFHVALQTSELTGAASILALSALIADRSKLVGDDVRANKTDEAAVIPPTMAAPEEAAVSAPDHGYYCCRGAASLPRYPLVDLEEAVEDLLHDIGPFAKTPEERRNLEKSARELAAPGSLGRKIYDDLKAKAEDPAVDSWIADFFVKALALKRRYPVAPYSNFFATHYDSRLPHTQAERAAVVATAAFGFKKDMDAGRLEPDYLGDTPLCDWSWRFLFNTVREPHVGCDAMAKYEGEDHVAVLRKGHVFKVALKRGGEDISYETLKAQFEAIVTMEIGEDSWAGVMTTDDRDSWGQNRDALLALAPANEEYFRTVESALFVICLDEGSPESREERVYQGYVGDGFNRWHDKSIQFVVSANGRSGQVGEHSSVDGVTTLQLVTRVQNAIHDHVPDGPTLPANGTPDAPEEFVLQTSPRINQQLQTLREGFLAKTSQKQYAYLELPSLGINKLLASGVPTKATVDLTIQVASRLYFGYNPVSWETVSTSHFHRGRPDIAKVTMPSVDRFCEVVADSGELSNPSDARAMLFQAGEDCALRVRRAAEGRNYFRLVDVMEVIAQDIPDVEMPALFSDPVWRSVSPRLIMQSILDGSADDVAYNLQDPESVWIAYSVWDDFTKFSIIGPRGKIGLFEEALKKAAGLMEAVLAAKDVAGEIGVNDVEVAGIAV